MKTARDFVTPPVIAAAWGAWRVRHKGRMGPGPGFVEALEAGFAALAAEGFSIVETGRDPEVSELQVVAALEATDFAVNPTSKRWMRRALIAARPTREGKTGPAVDSGDIGHG